MAREFKEKIHKVEILDAERVLGTLVGNLYVQSDPPTLRDGLKIGSLWMDTTANELKRVSVLDPLTFVAIGGGGGAPLDAEYLVGAVHAGLSAERLVTNTATVTWDLATAGQVKANVPAGAVTPASHAASHENGGADEINVNGLSGLLADPQTPAAHAASHQNGGSDEVNVVGLSGQLADDQPPLSHDILTKHSGFPGGTTNFLRADGAFAAPGGGSSDEVKAALSADYTNATTTGTAVTGLSLALSAGTYRFSYYLVVRSSSTTVGIQFGLNYTGTLTRIVHHAIWLGTGTSASTGIIDDDTLDTAGAEQIYEGGAGRGLTTTNPGLGIMTGFAAADVDCLVRIHGVLVVADAGNLELWSAAEAAGTVSIMTGSNVVAKSF